MEGEKDNYCSKDLLSVFLFFFFTFAYFFQAGQDNENARFDQTRAIIEKGEFTINAFGGNSADVVMFENKLYPNKAPGLAIAGVPPWFITTNIMKLVGVNRKVMEHVACYLTGLLTVGLTSALLSMVLFSVIATILESKALAFLAVLAYGLGTISFPFSTLFFSHQFAAALAFIAFGILFHLKFSTEGEYGRPLHGRAAVAGLALGYCLVSEYPLMLAAVPIGIYGLFLCWKKGTVVPFILAGLLGVLPLVVYNLISFHKVYFIPYSIYTQAGQSAFPEHKRGYMGVALPEWEVFKYIIFSAQRGLLFCNPWLLLILPALGLWWKDKLYRQELFLAAFIVVGFILFNAAFAPGIIYAGGGASVGPRHSIPMLPFAALLIAPVLRHRIARYYFYPTVLLSIAMMLVATAVEPRAPYEYGNPIRDLYWRNFLEGHLSIQRVGTFNSVFLTDSSVSFNLGELVHLPGEWQLAPLILIWTGFVWWWLGRSFRTLALSLGWTGFAIGLIAMPVAWSAQRNLINAGNGGLNGTYVSGLAWPECAPTAESTQFEKSLIVRTQVDEMLSFNWDDYGPPITGSFSAEWVGGLIVQDEDEYELATNSDDGSCLYVDGKLIVNSWGTHGARIEKGSLRLKAGIHPIIVRYENVQFGGRMELLWRRGPGHLQLLPKENFTRNVDKSEALQKQLSQ